MIKRLLAAAVACLVSFTPAAFAQEQAEAPAPRPIPLSANPDLTEDLENIWFLLQRVTDETIYAELSLPTAIENGIIVDWEERILLPQISRQNPAPTVTIEEPPAGDAYNVEVALR